MVRAVGTRRGEACDAFVGLEGIGEVGAKNQGVFESLGLVHGDDLDGLAVAGEL